MKLYRLMKVTDGKPQVGTKSMMLGVRPRDPLQPNSKHDVQAVIGSDTVQPGEGLSCYSDASAITIQSKKLQLWSIEVDAVPPELAAQPATEPHFHIEPRRAMTLDEFQRLLEGTLDLWEPEPGTGP